MSSIARVTIHESQFPDSIRRELLESFRAHRLNHKFLYDGVRQTQRWLALHEAHSPARRDANVAEIYDLGFKAAAARIPAARVHVIGLGCGGGQKDTRLLQLLKAAGKSVAYTPCDVSTAMVLVARHTALAEVPENDCFPVVCDLASTENVAELFADQGPVGAARLISFFGMIPNFEPEMILPKLASLVSADDWLLFSANLAPGPDYAAGVQKILPQYDNELTREWLLGFLLDHGVEPTDGELRFTIAQPGSAAAKRVEASFHFTRRRSVRVEGEEFTFCDGDSFRLFFSYRYTPELVERTLATWGLRLVAGWTAASEEEGVFLVAR